MLEINLLPKNFQEKLREKRIKDAYVETIVFTLIIIGVIIFGLFSINFIFSKLNNDASNQIKSDKQQLKKYASFEKEVKIYQENGKLYNTLTKDKYDWPTAINYINSLIPTQIQITNLTLSIDEKNAGTKLIQLSGKAIDRREIALFVNKMKSEKKLKAVDFTVGGADETGKVDFQIKTSLTQ